MTLSSTSLAFLPAATTDTKEATPSPACPKLPAGSDSAAAAAPAVEFPTNIEFSVHTTY